MYCEGIMTNILCMLFTVKTLREEAAAIMKETAPLLLNILTMKVHRPTMMPYRMLFLVLGPARTGCMNTPNH